MAVADEPKGETPEEETTTAEPEVPETETKGEAKTDPEKEKLKAALKKANDESASRRKKLEAYEKADKEKAEAELTEVERLRKSDAEKDKRIADAETALRETRLNHAIELEATALFEYPAAALKLVDRSSITFNDEGHVERKSVQKALKAIIEEMPGLKKGQSSLKPGTPPVPGARRTVPTVEPPKPRPNVF